MSNPETTPVADISSKLLLGIVASDGARVRVARELLERWLDWIDLTETTDSLGTIDGLLLLGSASAPAEPLSESVGDAMREPPAVTEERFSDEVERDHFFERALGHRRIRLLFHPSWSLAELTAFNTRERHRVIAHDPKRHRLIGRLVSKARDHARDDLEREIGQLYLGALAKPVTRRKHVNVLENVAEILDTGSSIARREEMDHAIKEYAAGREPLWNVLGLLRQEAEHQGLIGLAGQSYLNPDPIEHALRFASSE